jgi:hypothetical protein
MGKAKKSKGRDKRKAASGPYVQLPSPQSEETTAIETILTDVCTAVRLHSYVLAHAQEHSHHATCVGSARRWDLWTRGQERQRVPV